MRVIPGRVRPSETWATLEQLGVPILVVNVCSLFTAIFWSSASSIQSSWPSNLISCAADGSPIYPWHPPVNQIWNADSVVSITLGFGDFTFAQAKILDVCWDLIVGKGGQLLLSLLAYSIIRRSITLSMERKPVHLPLLASLTFDRVSLWSFVFILRDLFVSWNWRLIAIFQIITYVLTFGFLVSAMTAYQAKTSAWFRDPSTGNLVASSSLNGPIDSLIVVDGDRIGLQPDMTLHSLSVSSYYDTLYQYGSNVNSSTPNSFGYKPGMRNGVVNWKSPTASSSGEADEFNITWTSTGSGISYQESSIRLNGTLFQLNAPPLDIVEGSTGYFYDGGELLPSWLEQNAVCQPLKTYQWGFSSILLFTFCLMTILFALSLLALSSEVWMRSRVYRYAVRVSRYRDILDLAAEITNELGANANGLGPGDLDRMLQTRSGQVRIEVEDLMLSRSEELDKKYPATSKRHHRDAKRLSMEADQRAMLTTA